jgi:hypothetical protein
MLGKDLENVLGYGGLYSVAEPRLLIGQIREK